DRLLARWIRSAQAFKDTQARTVCYFSAEFLLGPHLGANILNLGIGENVRKAVSALGYDLDELLALEGEPGLGNGGLGRLAACYMDSLASLQVPAIGYGIRYEFGIFDQAIRDGWQVEVTDKWLGRGNPWEIPRPEIAFDVRLGGHTETWTDGQGRHRVRWVPHRVVRGVAYDTPILGFGVPNANLLRLWSAQAAESFDIQAFNVGDYYGAVEEKVASENLSKILYPNDEAAAGKQLRLEQQYFFVSCALQDMIRIYLQMAGPGLDGLARKYVVQLNDTHPAIAVAELMRLCVDEYLMGWDEAWELTRNMFAYTNHTLLPEALETWPVELVQSVLPRHLEIIYEINRRFLDEVRARYPGDEGKVQRLSLIGEGDRRSVRMANLACVGGHAVNGVAALHTELLKRTVLEDFYDLWPEKFSNKTNGVSPRRFLMLSNPGLADLITRAIGDTWPSDLSRLRALERHVDDAGFCDDWRHVKRGVKARLADTIRREVGLAVDPDSMFDIQVKRFHEYKRQHLNVLHVITLYNRLRQDPRSADAPRTVIFGGKAAPGYAMAKLIIKLITSVADVVNGDPLVRDRLKVVFLPNFNVKTGQHVYPAADLSEQISLAGKEASGTGNMKFAMNGSLTIGTLDGANVEIREEVGDENFFLFGLGTEEVERARREGYRPFDHYRANPELRQAIDLIRDGAFSGGDRSRFRPLVESLLNHDEYMLLADYASYIDCQRRVGEAWQDLSRWTRMSILNVARIGKFSSDRAIREYCEDIWKVQPMAIGFTD
ncbi:MAG TPA: glycogen/starch/alpha-glucan phosphorylase, partial [Candidatus Binatia bacterium]|nr:glycogen/starch/alpha-glucan phosphorylase [Candidatus Binatia bacterium]